MHAGTTRARTAHCDRKGRSAESVFVRPPPAAQGSFATTSLQRKKTHQLISAHHQSKHFSLKKADSFIMADALPGAAAAPGSALPGRGSRARASSGLASSGASGPPKHLDVAVSPTTPHTFDALPRKATTLEHMQKSQAGERSAAQREVGSSAAVSATSAQGGRADVSPSMCDCDTTQPQSSGGSSSNHSSGSSAA